MWNSAANAAAVASVVAARAVHVAARAVFDVATCAVFNAFARAVFNVAARAVVKGLSMWPPVRFPCGLSVIAACVAPVATGWPALSEKSSARLKQKQACPRTKTMFTGCQHHLPPGRLQGWAPSHSSCLSPGEALLVVPQPEVPADDAVFWTSYVKGMARACCALVVAGLVLDAGTAHPVAAPAAPVPAGSLEASLAAVHIRRGLSAIDRASVALENARLSARGAIRRAHDVITWVGTLRILQKGNPSLDASALIKRYNSVTTSAFQVIGAKRTACLGLLDKALPETIDRLVEHVSKVGVGQGCFTEDAFSNKRVLPGQPPRTAMPEAWAKRLQITPESFDLAVQYFIGMADRSVTKKKFDKITLETGVQMAALILSVSKDLGSTTPLPDAASAQLVAAFVAGDPSLEVELQCAVAEKTSGWLPNQLTFVKELLQEHTTKTEDARVPDAAESVKIQAGHLMAEEFALLEKKVEHDLHLVKVWGQKVRDRESQLYYQRLHHKEGRRAKAAGAAADLFSPTHRHAHFHEVPTRDESKIYSFLEDALGNMTRAGGVSSNQVARLSPLFKHLIVLMWIPISR